MELLGKRHHGSQDNADILPALPGFSFLLHTLEAGQDVMRNEMKLSSLSLFFLPYGTKGRGLG